VQLLRAAFVSFASLQVGGLFLDHGLFPYAGTLALLALLAIAVAAPAEHSASRRFGLAGLALITLTAALVDARTGGYGWPAEVTGGTIPDEAALLGASAALLSLAVLANAGLAGRGPLRQAALGVLPVLLVAGGGIAAVADLPQLQPHPAPQPALEGVRPHREEVVVFYAYRFGPAYRESVSAVPAPTDIPAVAGPPHPTSLWAGEIDWSRSWPALWAELLLLGLVALVAALFPADEDELSLRV
jgi:hypothetical protein